VVVVSYSGKEINAKLVYYGAGLSGKTTNLEAIYEAVPDTSRGKMVSMKTQSDRTLFFDLLPLDLGEIMGFKTRFLLYTVPGQVFYNATRKLVLKGADAIVFVADSEVGKMEENKESLANLKTNLAEYGLSLDEIPWVIQYNKRDLPNVYSVEELDAELNEGGKVPTFESVAPTGKGVFETFRGVSHLLMEKVTKDLRRTPFASAAARPGHGGTEPAAKSEPARTQAASPLAPQWSIAREAQETAARESGGMAGLDYGREITLPGDAAPRLKDVTAPADDPATSRPATGPAPAASQAAVATVGARQPDAGELVVPVTIPRGAAQQILLRIVLTVES
jgi:mutual gliding-motility protein MglA